MLLWLGALENLFSGHQKTESLLKAQIEELLAVLCKHRKWEIFEDKKVNPVISLED